jgi:pentatricopeptide repeat protein
LIAAVEKEQMMQVVVDAGRAGGSNVVPTAELLEAVAKLRATGMELTARENTILVSSLGRRGQCDAALRELGNIRACNVFHYNAALDACSKTGRWRDAIAILDEMEKAGTVPDAISFNCVIRACGSAGRAEEAFQLLEMMTWEVRLPCGTAPPAAARLPWYRDYSTKETHPFARARTRC